MAENHLVYVANPSTLQNLAAASAAVAAWRQEISNRWSSGRITEVCEAFLSVDKSALAGMPKLLKQKLEDHLELVGEALARWASYHCKEIFAYRPLYSIECLIEYLDEFVWRPEMSIDYERTAKKMLKWDKLSTAEKFSVACTYCFEEDIYNLKQLQSGSFIFGNMMSMERSLIHFWESRLKNTIPVIPYDIPSLVQSSIMSWEGVDNLAAIDYFWKYLKPERMVNQALVIIRKYNGADFTRHILTKLTRSQLSEVVAEFGAEMMLRMIRNNKLNEYTYQTWLYVKSMMTEWQFFDIIRGMLTVKRYDGSMTDGEVELCQNIWNTTDSNLKQDVIDNLLHERIPFEHAGCLRGFPRDVRFLITILNDASDYQRSLVWGTYWHSLVRGTHPFYVGCMMKICLRDEDIRVFKEFVMTNDENIKRYCLELATEQLFDELNEFLRFCSSDMNKILLFKQEILQSKFFGSKLMLNYHILRNINRFDDFIENSFRNAQLANNYKKEMINLPENVNFMISVIEIGDLQLVKNAVTCFLTSQQDLNSMKSFFLLKCRDLFLSHYFWNFNIHDWQDFIEWCTEGNPRRVQEFKRSIRIGEAFEIILSRCLEFQNHTHSCNYLFTECDDLDRSLYNLLDDVLLWVFENREFVKNFKLRKLHNYRSSDALMRAFREESMCIVDDLLSWFLNDREEVERFKLAMV